MDWPLSHESDVIDLPERPKAVLLVAEPKVETLTDRVDINRFRTLQILLNTTARIIGLSVDSRETPRAVADLYKW